MRSSIDLSSVVQRNEGTFSVEAGRRGFEHPEHPEACLTVGHRDAAVADGAGELGDDTLQRLGLAEGRSDHLADPVRDHQLLFHGSLSLAVLEVAAEVDAAIVHAETLRRTEVVPA